MKVAPKIVAVNVLDKNGVVQSNATVVAQSIVNPKRKWLLVYDRVDCCFGTPAMPQGLYKVSVKVPDRQVVVFKVRITSKPVIEQVVLGEKEETMIWFGGRQVPVKADGSSFAVGFSKNPKKESKSTLKNLVDDTKFEEKEFPGIDTIKIFKLKEKESKKVIKDEIKRLEDKKSVSFIKPAVELPNQIHGILTKEIIIQLVPGTNLENFAAKMENFDLRQTSVTSHFPNIYKLVYRGETSTELLRIVNDLDQMIEIERAELFFNTGGHIPTQVFPGDVLRPSQYYLMQMGVPEAWQILADAGLPTFGDADIINAVDDTGIGTSAMGATITHPDFNTAVVGGNLSAQLPVAVPNSKVYYAIDYRQNPAIPHVIQSNNDLGVPTPLIDNHGTETAGIILAAQNGVTGIVGIAANTRLLSVINPLKTIVVGTAFVAGLDSLIDYRMHYFGFDPNWNLEPLYPPGMAKPVPFNVPGLEVVYNINHTIISRSGPGASIVNQSYKTSNLPFLGVSTPYLIAGRKGRLRKGMISVSTAANDDRSYRGPTTFGPDNYTLIISASTIDHLGRETIAGYSNFAIDFSPGIDCCAPSNSSIGAAAYPINVGITTTTRTGAGNINDDVAVSTVLTAAVPIGGVSISALTGGVPAAGINSLVLLRRAGNPNISEWVVLAAFPAGNQYPIRRGTRHSYAVGDTLTVFQSTATTAPNYTTSFGGTSASAPMVSGVIALMLTANEHLTFQDVLQIIRTTSVPININHRGPRPTNITSTAAADIYTNSAEALISTTDLNWIQFAPAAFGTIAGSRPLMLATGLLDTNANPSIVSLGAPTYPPNNNDYPQWFINVGVLPGVGPNFQTRQAILVGVETLLLNDTLAGAQDFIDVVSAAGFNVGDSIEIGRYAETTLEVWAPLVGHTLDVMSTDGFQIGDFIDIFLTGGRVTRRITGFETDGVLMPPAPSQIIAGGKTRIVLDPAGPTITVANADAGVIVRTRSVFETTLVYAHGGAPPYVGRNLDVVAAHRFKVGESIDILLAAGTVTRQIVGFNSATQIVLDPAQPTISVFPVDASVIVRQNVVPPQTTLAFVYAQSTLNIVHTQTTLQYTHPGPPPYIGRTLDVVNNVGFAIGDTIQINLGGGLVTRTVNALAGANQILLDPAQATVTINPADVGVAVSLSYVGRTLDVTSNVGFAMGDTIQIYLASGTVSRQVDALVGATQLQLDPAQPTVTVHLLDAGAMFGVKYVGRTLDVASNVGFAVGDFVHIYLNSGILTRRVDALAGATQLLLDPAEDIITINPDDAGVLVVPQVQVETATITMIAPVAGGERLTINNGNEGSNIRYRHIAANHIPIRRSRTEIRAVKAVNTNGAGLTILEVDRLEFTHPAGVRITPGLIADYSFQFGYGRIDAPAAVRAALNYHLNDHPDVMIRDNMADTGTAVIPVADIQSEDIWVRNANDMLANPVAPADPGPHQMPALEFQIANFVGTPNHNDIIITGDYTGVALGTYVVTLDGAGNFSWTLDGGAATVAPIVAGTAQAMGALGISVIFHTTVYDGTEVWTITAQPQTRFVYVRATNRGAAPTFTPFALTGGGTPPDFYLVRAFLQLTDGSPVPRFDGLGLDDLEVTGIFGGPGHSKFEVQIDSTGGIVDTFKWRLDGGVWTNLVPIAVLLPQLLSNGVSIRFRAVTGHTLNDYWLLKARPAAERFKTLDDYVLANPSTRPYAIRSGRAGSRMLSGIDSANFEFAELEIDQSIDGPAAPALAAGANRIYAYPWPETDMPMVRAAFAPRPVNPLRMFLMAEVLPHDGALSGTTVGDNNNLSYRELIVARFGYLNTSGVNFDNFVEVDGLGSIKNETLVVDFVADVVSMQTESLKVRLEMELANNLLETRIFEFTAGAWQFTGGALPWAAGSAPVIGTSAVAAAGDQHHVRITFTLAVSNLHVRLKVTPSIHSAIQPTILLAKDVRLIPIYTKSLLPSQRYQPPTPANLSPRSHFFTEPTKILQTVAEAYGPVDGDKANKFRVTSLFKRVGAVEPKAYAPVDAFVVVQRDPANNNVVNLILKPFQQPMLGFTPIKYFIYRGIQLTDYLKGTSAVDEKLVRDLAGAPAFVARQWASHTAFNGAVAFESKAFGYDPATQGPTDLIDDVFFRQNPSFQLPKAQKGEDLGNFFTNGGVDTFGFEIILEEGDVQPDLAYVRKTSHVVDVTGMPDGTDAEKFALRLKREEILNYIDPAAFYGLHRSDGGIVKAFDGGVESTYTPDDQYANIINKFHTKNTLYIDIRNENGQSYNFYQQYDAGGSAALGVGLTAATIANQPYASDSWPLLIRNSVAAANPNAFDQVFLELQKDYNHQPILYIEHGRVTTGMTKGRFIADAKLGADPNKTSAIGFRFPNSEPGGGGGGGGNKIGTAWLLKMHYSLQIDPANMPFPDEVPPTESYLDNLFGPLNLTLNWKGDYNFAWHAAQDKKFIDASNLGFSQVVNRGLAIEDKVGATDRILFYANVKDSFFNTNAAFVPHKGLTGGTSKRDDFFDEKHLTDGFTLNYDLIQDGGTEIKSLGLAPDSIYPRPLESILMLGLGKGEYQALLALPGLNTSVARTVHLKEIAGSPFTANGKTYRKYEAGVRGLKDDGDHDTVYPAAADTIAVYSIDDLFFFSKKFSDHQPLPTEYTRNAEEALGAAARLPRNYVIASVTATTITIQGKDLRYDIIPTDQVVIRTSTNNDATYVVTAVAWNGTDTVLTVTAVGGGAPNLNPVGTLGDLHEVAKPYEDYFIAKDIKGVLEGIPPMSTLVADFNNAVAAATDNPTGLAALTTAVNDAAPKIWNRARALCHDANYEYADDRILYWARIKMLVTLKSHPQVLKSLSERNRLVKLLEDQSRGITGFAIAGAKKIVVAAVDPFYLTKNILYHNPGGSAALAMSGRTITVAGQTFRVEAVVLPARFRDLDRDGAGAGLVEEVFKKYVDAGDADYEAVDMILGLWKNDSRVLAVNRFAARNRGGTSDNENRPSPAGNPSFKLSKDLVGGAFYETSLEVDKIVPAANPDTHGFDVIYDNAFEYTWVDDTGTLQTASFLEQNNAAGQAKAENAAHPNHGTLVGNIPTALTPTSDPKSTDITSVSGSSGHYLGNELFYRLLRMKPAANATVKVGLLSLPNVQDDTGEFVADDVKAVIDALLLEIANHLTP